MRFCIFSIKTWVHRVTEQLAGLTANSTCPVFGGLRLCSICSHKTPSPHQMPERKIYFGSWVPSAHSTLSSTGPSSVSVSDSEDFPQGMVFTAVFSSSPANMIVTGGLSFPLLTRSFLLSISQWELHSLSSSNANSDTGSCPSPSPDTMAEDNEGGTSWIRRGRST